MVIGIGHEMDLIICSNLSYRASFVNTVLYLGCDDEEGGLSVELGEGLGHVRAINIRDEPDVGSSFRVRLQSFSHHQRTLKKKTS